MPGLAIQIALISSAIFYPNRPKVVLTCIVLDVWIERLKVKAFLQKKLVLFYQNY